MMEAVAKREEEEKGNAMKALENRTQDSKVEMDIMDALEELQVWTLPPASPPSHPRGAAGTSLYHRLATTPLRPPS